MKIEFCDRRGDRNFEKYFCQRAPDQYVANL